MYEEKNDFPISWLEDEGPPPIVKPKKTVPDPDGDEYLVGKRRIKRR